jgi:hypothetical protein
MIYLLKLDIRPSEFKPHFQGRETDSGIPLKLARDGASAKADKMPGFRGELSLLAMMLKRCPGCHPEERTNGTTRHLPK